jgi:hypothetical protein
MGKPAGRMLTAGRFKCVPTEKEIMVLLTRLPLLSRFEDFFESG